MFKVVKISSVIFVSIVIDFHLLFRGLCRKKRETHSCNAMLNFSFLFWIFRWLNYLTTTVIITPESHIIYFCSVLLCWPLVPKQIQQMLTHVKHAMFIVTKFKIFSENLLYAVLYLSALILGLIENCSYR